MSQDEEMEFYLQQEKDSAAIDGYGFDDEAFRLAWKQTTENKGQISSQSRKLSIALPNIDKLNPLLSATGEHEFITPDMPILAKHGFLYVNDLISLPKEQIEETYNNLRKDGLNGYMTLVDFRDILKNLKKAFPNSHYFLAQPVPQTEAPASAKAALPCRPDGGRDGSGMMF